MATHHFAEPLHIFSIPQAVLANLVVRPSPLAPQLASSASTDTPETASSALIGSFPSNSTICTLCLGVSFVDVSEQRAHFRSDWHRYNVKLRLRDAKSQPASEVQFSALMGELEDSLSGSASSEEEEASEEDTVSALLHKTHIKGRSRSVSPSLDRGPRPRSPVLWLTSTQIPDTQFGIYTVVFPTGTAPSASVDELKAMQDGGQRGKQWAVFMTAGGHFAGSVIRVCHAEEDSDDQKSASATKKKSRDPQRNLELEVIKHKTFHRYTSDERLRTFPFPTRRPTQSELIRCVTELIRVKVSHYTEEDLAAQDQALLASLPKPKVMPTPAASDKKPTQLAPLKLTKEEQHQRDLWSRLLEMVRKGRLDALKTFWDKQGLRLIGGVDGRLPEWLEGKDSGAGGTLLQVAAAAGQDEVVRWILEDLHADPTIIAPPSFSRARNGDGEAFERLLEDLTTPTGKQTAYDLSPNSQTRNVFRRCAYTYPDRWDWLGAAGVRSILTPEMEAKERKKEESRRKLREKAKEREAANSPQIIEEPEPVAPSPRVKESPSLRSGSQKLGGQGNAESGMAGLTPEMRARVERERRARAAEARLNGLKSG
ncbi:hypothetical protein FRB97_002765 [Tulasnella sp. 331]|nr:hypothetical protein FRB97_002765 [Tulasnella sp. 331]